MAYGVSDPYEARLWLTDWSLFSVPPPWAVIPMCLVYISGCCNFLFSPTLSLLSHSFNKVGVEHLFCVWHCGLGDIAVRGHPSEGTSQWAVQTSCPYVVTWCFQLSSVWDASFNGLQYKIKVYHEIIHDYLDWSSVIFVHILKRYLHSKFFSEKLNFNSFTSEWPLRRFSFALIGSVVLHKEGFLPVTEWQRRAMKPDLGE